MGLLQQKTGTATSGTTVTITLDSLPTVRSWILLNVASVGAAARSISSVAQTGVTWASQPAGNTGSGYKLANGTLTMEEWFGFVTASSSTSILLTMNGTLTGCAVHVGEFSAVAASAPIRFNTGAGGSATSTNPNTNTTTIGTPSIGDLIVMQVAYANGTAPSGHPSTPSLFTPCTLVSASTVCSMQVEYFFPVSSAVSHGGTWTITSAANACGIMILTPAANWKKGDYWWQRATDSSGSF